jgi:hypothetical protein
MGVPTSGGHPTPRPASPDQPDRTGRQRRWAHHVQEIARHSFPQQYSCSVVLAPRTERVGPKMQEEAISRILCPRGGVHSSWPCVTARLQQPTRKPFPPRRGAGTGDPRLPYSVLLRMGFTVPSPSPERRCALTAPFHPYPPTTGGRSAFCGTFPRVATAGRYPACCPSGVRTFLDDPKTAANAHLLLRRRE